MKRTIIVLFLFQLYIASYSQEKKTATSNSAKLVVGIVVDQMRNDYISRYWERFGNGGFKRLVNEGFYFRNTHYNYIPTFTGPGHASIYTGTTPRHHGIIANEWYSKEKNYNIYCCYDDRSNTVGAEGHAGKASPSLLLSSTVTDELRITHPQSKVFGISIKDRSAIFPAGHAANGAFWYDDATGNFVSSTWYMKELPAWMKNFNDQKKAKSYLQKGWSTLYPIESYTNSIADNNRYEHSPFKEEPTFPYDFRNQLEAGKLSILKGTPYGNSIVKEAAIECIKSENLGKDAITDFFALSFSSPDIIGHSYGPRSIEIEDVYLRLDRDIEEMLNFLDQFVGKNNYIVFLTADHGAGDVPAHLADNKIPAGNIYEKLLKGQVRKFFQSNYGDTALLANLSNEQIFISEKKIAELKLERSEVESRLCRFLLTINGIAEAYPASVFRNQSHQEPDPKFLLQQGFNHKLSGNVVFIYQPGWMENWEKGTTHGSGYNYDTHVPLLFFGHGIKKGESFERATITQIAPTLSELLKINKPNSCYSPPLNGYFK